MLNKHFHLSSFILFWQTLCALFRLGLRLRNISHNWACYYASIKASGNPKKFDIRKLRATPPGVHPTSTSRDVSDQAFPSRSNFYFVLQYICGEGQGSGLSKTCLHCCLLLTTMALTLYNLCYCSCQFYPLLPYVCIYMYIVYKSGLKVAEKLTCYDLYNYVHVY